MTSLLRTNDGFREVITYLVLIVIVVEIGFYAFFRWVLIPRANDISRRKSQPYRDYPTSHRHVLFLRILKRIEDRCEQTHKEFEAEFSSFLSRWFNGTRAPVKLGPFSTQFFREELNAFFSWAFFDKSYGDLSSTERQELQYFYDILQKRHGIRYLTRSEIIQQSSNLNSPQPILLQPRCMTLEPVDPLHRPFSVYLLVGIGKIITYIILRVSGFRRYVAIDEAADEKSTRQLVYWFKQASTDMHSSQQETILFFHGIAPAGLLFYIPLLYNTFCNHALGSSSKNILLFQNDPITCSMSFEALSEQSTISCIKGILEKHVSMHLHGSEVEDKDGRQKSNLCLIGHSFGSCQVSWLLYCPFIRPFVRKIVLLDPVSILLSEPDVMANFLYNRSFQSFWFSKSLQQNSFESSSTSLRKLLIRLVASSELFTEHYLRRNFSWYNSELWLDDVPEDIEVCIYLSERDNIVNAKKIQEEIQIIHNKQPEKISQIRWWCWEGVGHASCLTNPNLWKDIINGWHPKQE